LAWTFYVMHDQLLHFNISENPISEKSVMRTTLRCKAVLATFWFPANLGLFFVELRVFLKTCGLLVFGLVLIEIFCFLGLLLQISVLRIAFFQILWHFCCFNFLPMAYWACFCENLLILGLFFRIFHRDFLFDFLADFLFCWIYLPTHFGLVFGLNYLFGLFFKFTWLFLQNNLASLLQRGSWKKHFVLWNCNVKIWRYLMLDKATIWC